MKTVSENMAGEEQAADFQSTIEKSTLDLSNNNNQWNNRDFSVSNQQWSNSDFSNSNPQYYANEYTPLVSTTHSLVAYKRRWVTLFIFSMNTMMNGLLFMSLSPINNIAVRYYRVPAVKIEWLCSMCTLSYIFLALPSSFLMSKWGVRPMITIASCLDFTATCLHFLGRHRDSFWLVLFGQVFAAVAYSMIIQIPGKLSSQWFPEKESATATSIGVFMNLLGVSLGFLQPSIMVKQSEDMNIVQDGITSFFISQMTMAAIILLLTLAYKEKPPTPPTLNSLRDSSSFSILVSPLITSKFPTGYEASLGWMGFWCDMAAILSCFVIGLLLDKYHAHQLTSVLLNFFSMLIWLAFVLVLTYMKQFYILYGLFVLLGVCGVPYFASGMEQAAEMTYPASEEVSSTIILILGNLYGFLFIFILGAAAQSGYVQVVGYTMAGLYFVSTVLAVFAKTELKRYNAEKQANLKIMTVSKHMRVEKNYSEILP